MPQVKPLLSDVTIEITNHCQLHCQHCGIWAEKERHEMTASTVIRLLRELLQRYEICHVSITGGEPFLNRNCGRLLKALSFHRERGDIDEFGVYTNGAYFEGVRRVFDKYGRYLRGMELGISVDGKQGTHDLLRGAGAYQKTLKTIEWLAANFGQKIDLELKFTINRANFTELEDVYRLAKNFNAQFSPKIMESGVTDYYHRHQMPESGKLATLTEDMVAIVTRQMKRILSDGYSGIDRDMAEATMVLLTKGRSCIRACATPARALFINSRRIVFPCLYMASAGKVGADGTLPQELDAVRHQLSDEAAQGRCPGCFAYHGFLKKFNLEYLR